MWKSNRVSREVFSSDPEQKEVQFRCFLISLKEYSGRMKIWIRTGTLAIVCVASAGGTWAQSAPGPAAPSRVPIYSKNDAPATPKLEDLPRRM
jgi:hypothetical protein